MQPEGDLNDSIRSTMRERNTSLYCLTIHIHLRPLPGLSDHRHHAGHATTNLTQGECEREMFVQIRWRGRSLAMPLAQLRDRRADPSTHIYVEIRCRIAEEYRQGGDQIRERRSVSQSPAAIRSERYKIVFNIGCTLDFNAFDR